MVTMTGDNAWRIGRGSRAGRGRREGARGVRPARVGRGGLSDFAPGYSRPLKGPTGSPTSAPMLSSLGPLRFPFIAGAAALVALALIWSAWGSASVGLEEVILGLLIGGLGVVVLYATMRALARPS